jgi:predicted amidohydrolase YtcJ
VVAVERADKTFFNGKIYTMNEPGEVVEAIIVRDGRIVFAGTDEEARKWDAKEREDLHGRTVLPGFSDTHIHVLTDCLCSGYVDLGSAQCIAEVIEMVRAADDGLSEGWLCAEGLCVEKLAEKRFPTRRELDEIGARRPILMTSDCGLAQMMNSSAFAVTGTEPRDTSAEMPYGYGWTRPAYMKSLLRSGLSVYPACGLTTLHAIGLMPETPSTTNFDQYFEMEKGGDLPVRVVVNPSQALPWSLNPITGFGTDMVKLGSKKIFLDGILSDHTAALLEPYADAPNERGRLLHSERELTTLFEEAYDAGLEVSVHVIGDAAMECALIAAEKVYPKISESCPEKRLKSADRRLRLVHAMVIAPEQVERLAKLPVILDVQPSFLRWYIHLGENLLGADRLKSLMPFQTLIDHGILLTGGSDAPVDAPTPLRAIQCAVTRRDQAGFPNGGFVPKESVSVYDAVSMYTRNAAYCSNEEDIKGTISTGKYADFIVLDQDIFTVEPNEISNIRILETVLGGASKHRSGGSPVHEW